MKEYEVRENSNIPSWMQGGPGYLMLQHLDMDGIRLIGSVLGQSIALYYYVRKVAGVIAAFTQLYRGRKKISNYIKRKSRMFRLVGIANSSLAEVMFNLGLFERSEISSMEDPNYSRMLEYLHDQFELNQKFVGLDFYLTLMEDCKKRGRMMETLCSITSVDQWVKEYSGVNYGLEKRGSISSWIKLFKHSRSRAPDADAISHYFGLSERSDIAWKGDTKYAQMLDYLRDEFELSRRYAGLDRKFKMGEKINEIFSADGQT
ncbi:hypothetical protein MKW92_002832 [Papaver armeniacum]|nr:hypothetical protein MKW92_002832 [Papaver armeniacum]